MVPIDSSTPLPERARSTIWENVLRHFKDAVIVLDKQSTIVFFNQAAEELTRTPRAKVLGHHSRDAFPDSPILTQMVERTQSTKQSETRGEETLRIRQRDIPARVTCVPIWDDVGEVDGHAIVVQDLSYQKTLEESARRNESLARLGTLVAGMAHEIRNPLAGIKGAAQLLAKKLPDDRSLSEYTEVISSETDRLSALVEDLLHLGVPPKPTLSRINIHAVLQRALTLLAPEEKQKKIVLACHFDPSLPDIMADQNQLEQVFLNLIKNAFDAMAEIAPEARRLILQTKMETDYHILRKPEGPSSYLRVEVNDAGPGIEPEALSRIFEPFYTTKARGTGLGLAIAQRIVSDHHGSMRAFAVEPNGTSVWVSLPIQKDIRHDV